MDYEVEIKEAVIKSINEYGSGDRWHEFVNPARVNRRNDSMVMDKLNKMDKTITITNNNVSHMSDKLNRLDQSINGNNGESGLKSLHSALKARIMIMLVWLTGLSATITLLAKEHFK